MSYQTVTQHCKLHPFTSLMAAPYSCDSSGVADCAAAIEQIKTNQSNVGTIYIPVGTFKIATNLTIPIGMSLRFAKGGQISVSTGVTLTVTGYIEAGPWQIFTGTGTVSINTTQNIFRFGAWTGSSGITLEGVTTYPSSLSVGTTLTVGTSLTITAMSSAGFVKNSVAGLLSGGNSIAVGDLPAAIPATKIADGTISDAEFQYLNGATSNIQDQIDAVISSILPYAILQDKKTSGTAGGTFTSGSWQVRTLNTEVVDASGIVSLASDQFTLQAGTYRIKAVACAGIVGLNRLAIYNVTDTAYAAYGVNHWAAGSGSNVHATMSCVVTIAAAKAFELRHRCATTQATVGLGTACTFGVDEIYAQVEIWKMA